MKNQHDFRTTLGIAGCNIYINAITCRLQFVTSVTPFSLLMLLCPKSGISPLLNWYWNHEVIVVDSPKKTPNRPNDERWSKLFLLDRRVVMHAASHAVLFYELNTGFRQIQIYTLLPSGGVGKKKFNRENQTSAKLGSEFLKCFLRKNCKLPNDSFTIPYITV